MNGTPVDLQLQGGAPVSISALARQTSGVSADTLLSLLRRLRADTKARLGVDPFRILESPTGTVIVEATSYVGLLSHANLRVAIQPKIEGLSFEEALFLAHMGNRQTHVRHQNQVVERLLQRDLNLESTDLLAAPFLAACIDVINNGLLTQHRVRTEISSRLRGQLVLQKQVQRVGRFYPWYSEWDDASRDVPENQILKLALASCVQRLTHQRLRSIAAACHGFFDDVQVPSEFPDLALSAPSSLRRADYERAVELARLVVQGLDPLEGAQLSYLPTFLLNMDEVFEALVTHQLSKLIMDPCQVRPSLRETHGLSPEVKERHIELDALFTRSFENAEKRHIVIDAKNKYSGMDTSGVPLPPDNPDLFQTTFYASRFNARAIVVVYPTAARATEFPLLGSQGHATYRNQVGARLKELKDQATLLSHPGRKPLPIFTWSVKVTGGPDNVYRGLAQLANFLIEFSDI